MNQSWGFPSQQRFDPFHRQGALAALLCCARQWMKMFRFWLEVREHFCGMRKTVLSSYNIRAFSWFAASLWAPSLNMVFAQNFYAKPTPNSQQKRSFESICAMSGFLGVECAWFSRSRHLTARRCEQRFRHVFTLVNAKFCSTEVPCSYELNNKHGCS